MPGSALASKLGIRPGQRVVMINPPRGFVNELGELPEGVSLANRPSRQPADLVHLFVHDRAELDEEAPRAIRALGDDAILWIAYPKKTSGKSVDLTRDVGWDVLDQEGFRPVSQIAIDETWSALRFRRKEFVGSVKRRD